MNEDELKEIEQLLLSAKRCKSKPIKKCFKLAIPHVILVSAVCLYAVAGAWIFYSLESPHEDQLKKDGVQKISELRQQLLDDLVMKRHKTMQYQQSQTDIDEGSWSMQFGEKFQEFNKHLYRAFKEQYVRYPDIAVARHGAERRKRQKRHKRVNLTAHQRSSKKLWTASSAVFFAATTMATIGYGNIVPVTPYGRLACVIFALFGAPLTIITIGDLGKFLSECTIRLYCKMQKLKRAVRRRLMEFKYLSFLNCCQHRSSADRKSAKSSRTTVNWEDLILDKTDVPVLLVFAILILYIAFGGILFATLESWTYMDAFYFCKFYFSDFNYSNSYLHTLIITGYNGFISLTTIGFGDLVPQKHEHILLMLAYLGVGLAVTTMCIDLVGIKYIQKIHYFGRKFRGTDILQLLKRKRIIERHLAMGQGDELIQLYLKQLHEARVNNLAQPLWHHCNNNTSFDSNNIVVHRINEQRISEPMTLLRAERAPSPSLHSMSSVRVCKLPSDINRVPTDTDLNNLHLNVVRRSKSPSVLSIVTINQQYCQPSSSTQSCAINPPNYEENDDRASSSLSSMSLGESSRSSPLFEVPNSDFGRQTPPKPDLQELDLTKTVESSESLESDSPIGMACMQEWESYNQMLIESEKAFSRQEVRTNRMRRSPQEILVLDANLLGAGEADEEVVDSDDIHSDSGRRSIDSSALLLQNDRCRPMTIDLGAYELLESQGMTMDVLLQRKPVLYHHGIPVHSVHQSTVQTESAIYNIISANQSMVSVRAPPSVVDDNYCFVVRPIAVEILLGECKYWRNTSQPVLYYYSRNLRLFQRVSCIKARGKIIAAKILAGAKRPTVFGALTGTQSESQSPPTPAHFSMSTQFNISESESLSSLAGEHVPLLYVYKVTRYYSFWRTCPTFHRVITKFDHIDQQPPSKDQNSSVGRMFVQYLWRNTKPSDKARVKLPEDESSEIYHEGAPVYAVENRAFDTNMAMRNVLNCPVNYISKEPPMMATENYCFVIDGETVKLEEISEHSKNFWKDTSTSTRYYLSDEMRTFYQVNALLSHGEIRHAYIHKKNGLGMEQVPLNKLYKVTRLFSHWKSCTGFHRIISEISAVTEDEAVKAGFHKRILVQYLWRINKQSEKERVELEYNLLKTSIPGSRRSSMLSSSSTDAECNQMPRLSKQFLNSNIRKRLFGARRQSLAAKCTGASGTHALQHSPTSDTPPDT